MEQKLKLVFRSLTLRLAFKAGVFAGLLFLLKIWDFGLIPILIFLIASAVLYAKPFFKTFELITPFFALLAISLISSRLLAESPYFGFLIVFLAFLFYLILGIKDLALIQRTSWHRFVNISLAYTALLIFFYTNQEHFLPKILFLFLIIFLLLRNLIRKRLIYWLTAFLILESAWAISLLPIGFISSANLGILIYFIITDLALLNIEGALTRKKILIDTSIFIIILLAILALSRWGL